MQIKLTSLFKPAFFVIIACTGCDNAVKSDNPSGNTAIVYPEFTDETEVTINGYSMDAMEPFIAKDGTYLFFNNLNDGRNTSLYYAVRINDFEFNFAGEINGVNGTPPHLDAVASMDEHNNFFFLSTRDYPDIIENYQTGKFNNGTVTDVRPVKGNIYINSPGWIVMDAEISGDGNLLIYSNTHFSGGSIPDESKLGIAEKNDSVFIKLPVSDNFLKNINDSNYVVYAPCYSSDGKELYFTRFREGTLTAEICVSVRNDTSEIFSIPDKIEIPGNVTEAPTLTGDGRIIYYHKKLSDNKHHIFTMRKK
ncbi:MAG: PD40 domain-containing protein [Bacteroidetes bacterium]|nr:PD40 domain-containing protein [Bacteroidota bacterium]